MRPFCSAILMLLALTSSSKAGFELYFDPYAQFLPDTANQTVDLYLRSTTGMYVSQLRIATFIGSTQSAASPPQDWRTDLTFRGSEGNFQKSVPKGGVELDSSGDFWGGTGSVSVLKADYLVDTVTQVQLEVIGRNATGRAITTDPVKVATFHIDTTDFLSGTLVLRMSDTENYFLPGQLEETTVLAGESADTALHDWVGVGNGLTITNAEYTIGSITSTPEPSVIGMLGLSLAGGAGWLRARARRRKAAQ